jgi:hypothetical protein
MMQFVAGRRALALVAALALATAGSAFAQDTTETGRAAIDTTQPSAGALDTAGVDTLSDTSDTSGVQNPPGYRGMERDTTMVPPRPTTGDTISSDTTGGDGYRSDRPAAADSAVHDSMAHGSATPDSTQ